MSLDFGDNFNVIDWINKNLVVQQTDSVSAYEKAASSLLTKLQLQSRDESQTADQNIKAVASNLPQSMAKLSHIGSTVDELSESLRNLTNSGYKFKSGNIPDKIGELSSLKVRRDHLREAGEIITNGIRIETDIQELQQQCNTGQLKDLCIQYEKVYNSSKSLTSISKFDSLNKNLNTIKITLEDRLKHLMQNACSAQNSATFIENSNLSKKISSSGLELDVASSFISSRIKSIHNNYNSGDLDIIDWLQPCFKDCLTSVVDFSNWCLSLTPPVFNSKIHENFIEMICSELNPAIESQAISLIKEHKFDKVVAIVSCLESSWAQIPSSWYIGEKSHRKLLNGIEKARVEFISQFKSFLESELSPPQSLPKSNTSESLRQIPNSPMKQSVSSSFDSLTMPGSTINFDTKLPQFVQTAMKSIEWVSALSADVNMCLRLSSSFLSHAINGATKEFLSKKSIASDDVSKVKSLISVFKIAKEQAQIVEEFENKCLKLTASISHSAMDAANKMTDAIESEIITAMAAPSLKILKNLSTQTDWSEDNDLSDVDLGDDESISMPIGESMYITLIWRSIFEFVRLLTNDASLKDELRSDWMQKATNEIAKAYVLEITRIPTFSDSGAAQMRADLASIKQQMLDTLGLSLGKDIEDIAAILNAKGEERKKKLNSPDVSKLVSVSLSKSLGVK